MGSVAEFYDELSTDYHRLYPDWPAAIDEQGRALHDILVRCQGPGPHSVLDAAAGIGTQLLGLASHGHRLCGNDISASAIHRAQAETALRGLSAVFTVGDMRTLPYADQRFDAVVCADNAVAHLVTPHDLTSALAEMRRVVRAGGHVLVSTRDYEDARRHHPPGTVPQVARDAGATTVTVQLWDWQPSGATYDLRHLQLTDDGDRWVVTQRSSRLWAITRAELTQCAQRAGLDEVHWQLPLESHFFQPLLVARVP